MSLGTSILECVRTREFVQHELLPVGTATDRAGNLARANFYHTGGWGIYFARIGNGPKWRVEVFENDDDPEERAYVFGRDANNMRNAIRLLNAWNQRFEP